MGLPVEEAGASLGRWPGLLRGVTIRAEVVVCGGLRGASFKAGSCSDVPGAAARFVVPASHAAVHSAVNQRLLASRRT
jgi:hypothetical protein